MEPTLPIDPAVRPAFSGLGIEPKILDTLTRLQFTTPTPIQHKAIPVALEGKDIIGIAQTGTGKTLAFSVPILQRLMALKTPGRALILLPTRELAIQVEETFKKIGYVFGLRTALLIGGSSMGRQIHELRYTPHVIFATPGRLIDHIRQKTLSLSTVCILVLDEADRMLDMGFLPQIRQILQTVPKDRQTMLFSATMPDTIVSMAMAHMKLPVRVEIARPGTAAERVDQEVFIVRPNQKIRLLEALLVKFTGTVLVFSRTKYGAKKICSTLARMGHAAAEIHSNRSLFQRKEALHGFQTGKYRVLVATDIASRGIDVKGIQLVVNYDIPEDAEDYVHRIGRTARAGHTGHAITFAMPDQEHKVRHIERLIKMALRISELPELPPDPFPMVHEARPPRPPFRPRQGSSRRHSSGRSNKRHFFN